MIIKIDYLVAVGLLLAPAASNAQTPAPVGSIERYGEAFSLSIRTSFQGQFEFKLIGTSDGFTVTVEGTKISYGKDDAEISKKVSETIHLDSDETKKILSLFKAALLYNSLDDMGGLDGSTWCLKSERVYSRTSACFWSPDVEPEERGLDGLYRLGVHLASLSKNKLKIE
jgi:hypothetical protein